MKRDINLRVASPPTEYSEAFIQGMLNRMAVSFFKYGLVADAFPGKVSALASAAQRVEKYQETKNTEYLMDAANFLMIEFMHPSLEGAHFAGTDSDGSPGRTTIGGRIVTNERNKEIEV